MISKASPYYSDKLSISDWELEEKEGSRYPTIVVPGIITITSREGLEECKVLLRAVVNTYIRVKLMRQGVTQHWQRERQLLIKYAKKEDWEWRIELLDVAKAYAHFENRPQHRALVEISGSIVRFESNITSQYRHL